MEAASYYSDLTAQYGRYGGAAQAWHYGLWEPDVHSHQQSLLRSSERLLRGLEVGPATRILDVGFGSGGFATWAAATTGCRVTGISICADHVPLARRLAEARGVARQCDFLAMDMDGLALGSGTFDVVVNQDTLCHSADKTRYLESIYRVLRPGGCWRAIAFAVQQEPLSDEQAKSLRAVLEGFHIPSLLSARQVEGRLERGGFVDIRLEDLTEQVQPSAAHVLRQCFLPYLMMQVHMDWTFFSLQPRKRRNRQGHVLAGREYSRGLQRGYFRHYAYSARKPG